MSYPLLVIPTYNRSKKIERVLRCYQLMDPLILQGITVLDGSDNEHLQQNEKLCKQLGVKHIARPNTGVVERLSGFFCHLDGKQIIALGNDEDIFLSRFLQQAESFLTKDHFYSSIIGRYITFLRPIGPFSRVSHERDVVVKLDVNHPDANRRISLLSQALLAGCAPVFWGVRRAEIFQRSFLAQSKLQFETSQELIDQILLAHSGAIRFIEEPMLLRDETKIAYIIGHLREAPDTYIPSSDMAAVLQATKEVGGASLESAADAFLDKYSERYMQAGENLAVSVHKKAYCKYHISKRDSRVPQAVKLILRYAHYLAQAISGFHEIREIRSTYGKKFATLFTARISCNQMRIG